MTNCLVSKDGTYNTTAFDKPWWDGDFRFGFDPPEEEGPKRREKEWHRQFQRQQQQINEDWAVYEREALDLEKNSPSPAAKGNVSKEKDQKETPKKAGGFGSILSNAMKPSLKKLARHGIPSELRAKIWFEKSGACQKKQDNPGVYAKYIATVPMDSSAIEEIQMDIARTFSMHLMFATSHTKTMMLRILAAFTVRNPSYGYCQNMTFIVGLILFFLPEEDAFWLFVTIIEDILPVDFCSPTLMGLRVDQKILEVLLKERLPKLYTHFVRCNIDLSCFTTSWLLRLFVNVFPIQTTLRIWDCFLIEGSKILFRVALAFLKIHDEAVKLCNDSGELMTFLTTECRQFYDADRLIKACASFWALRRKQINELRMKFIKEELEENPQLAAQYTPGGTGPKSESSSDDETNAKSPTKSESTKTLESSSESGRESEKPSGKENEKPNGKENEQPKKETERPNGWESDRPVSGAWETKDSERGRSPRGPDAVPRSSLVIGGHSRSPSREAASPLATAAAGNGRSHSRNSSKDSNSSNSRHSSVTSNTGELAPSNLRSSNTSNASSDDADKKTHDDVDRKTHEDTDKKTHDDVDKKTHDDVDKKTRDDVDKKTHSRTNSRDTTDSTFPTSTFSDSTDVHTNTPNDTTTSQLTHSRTSSNDTTDNSTTSITGLHLSADAVEAEGNKEPEKQKEKEEDKEKDKEEDKEKGIEGEKKGDGESGGEEETHASPDEHNTGAPDENSKNEIGTEAENLATSTNSSMDDFVVIT